MKRLFSDKFHQRLVCGVAADNLMVIVKHGLGIFADGKIHHAFYLAVFA